MGYLFALMATLLWSGNAVAARFLAGSVPAVGVSFWRWAIAVLICFPATYPAFKRNIPAVKEHWKYLVLLSFLGVCLFTLLLYTAAHTTTAFNIAVLSTITPVIILVFSFIFAHERLSRAGLAGFALAALGIICLVTNGHPVRILHMQVAIGDGIMIFASAVFASYTVLVRRKPPEITVNTLIFCTFHLGFLMLVPVYAVQEIYFTGVTFGRPQVLGFIYIGVFASFVSYMFWNRAVVTIGAARSAAVYYSLPVFTGVFGWLILGEALSAAKVLSMLMVGFGVYLTGKK